jgi:N-acetylglucosamine-6-phosphate deacetylase
MGKRRLRIVNARIVLADTVLEDGTLEIAAGKIAALFEKGKDDAATFEGRTLDFGGDIVMPGLIDLHVHGAGGSDVMDASAGALEDISCALLREGTTAFLGTTLAAPAADIQSAASVAAAFHPENQGAELLGLHVEGPFLNTRFKGAQPSDGVAPGKQTLQELNGWDALLRQYPELFRILTLAPEHPNSKELIQLARKHGLIVSAGHSGATFEQMQEAVEAGVRLMTHAFNGMTGIHHRQPGLLTAGLLDSQVCIELIADGVHVHPAVLELAIRLKTTDMVILVSDGTRAVGMPDGNYTLGGQPIAVKEKRAMLEDGTLAGSAAALLDGVRTVVGPLRRSLVDAARMAAANPARLLGADHRIGTLSVGLDATFIRLSGDMVLKEVWLKGERKH